MQYIQFIVQISFSFLQLGLQEACNALINHFYGSSLFNNMHNLTKHIMNSIFFSSSCSYFARKSKEININLYSLPVVFLSTKNGSGNFFNLFFLSEFFLVKQEDRHTLKYLRRRRIYYYSG